jgi:Chemotaxis response regulator containing a CheY-like receiver domain and a methylesterase domain
MMKKNILIIDDSALIRRVLSDIIASDDRFQVSEIVRNGVEGLDLLMKDRKFDAILLDINMPKMNGLEFLEQMNRLSMKATIIVVSTLTKQGAKETIRALELGAFDFITKPESFLEAQSELFRLKILNCLAVATGIKDSASIRDVNVKSESKSRSVVTMNQSVINSEQQILVKPDRRDIKNGKKLIALACSTGGPKALQEVIPKLPANLDVPMLIVQHMPEGFTASLAQRLNELSNVQVKEAQEGDVIRKGVVYIAKGGSQMRVQKLADGNYKLNITDEPARNGLRPCADIMYESLVSSEFEEITCVVLTGMGGDGTKGIRQLKEHNNVYVIAQSAETCTVYGMPKVIAEAGLVNEVVPLNQVSNAIVKNLGVR